ncbi:MAG: GEVED domain-containing protein, partial [Planctomycetaceae bacterium]|nr:GEVED domain-containing protein [Planctomycetaceae bacterium]
KREIRFRLTTDATLEVNQFASDGNFVDMTVDVIDKRRSFGNAPGNGNTLAKDGGASHLIVRDGNGNSQLALGTKAIETRDGQPARNTDDFGNLVTGNDGLGDCVLVIRGAMSYIEVIVTNTTSKDAYLNIWVDLNNTFLFNDHPAKHIVVDEVIPAGTPAGTVVTIDVTGKIPGSLPLSQTVMQTIVPGEAFLRMRLSDQRGIGPRGAMGPDGHELKGEVEDHVVKLLDHGATISGYVFKDVVGNGAYGPMNQAVPPSDVVVKMGTTVPFSLGGTEAGYSSAGQATGISNSVQLLPFAVRVGGKTYDSFIVTDKGAVMLVDWMSVYGYYQIINGQLVYVTPSAGVPSLYSGSNPTFAPFLSNMTSAAEVSYVTGVDEDGRNFVKFLWDDDFGVCITSFPAFVPANQNDNPPEGYINGDLVTFFYSEEFIERLQDMLPSDFSPVQIGTNFAYSATYTNTDPYIYGPMTYYSLPSLLSYLDSLEYVSVVNPDYDPDFVPEDPDDPDEPLDPEPEFIQGAFKHSTYRLNPAQGLNVTNGVITTLPIPDPVILPETTARYMPISINQSSSGPNGSVRQSSHQSFGFWFEFGGQRYGSYQILDNGIIGLVNANGYVDAYIELGVPYVSTTPTVDVTNGVTVRGNKFVQIRWNSAMGVIIEDDPSGDIVSFFYADLSAYPRHGVDLGGPNANTRVYTDLGSSFVGFRYADGSAVNIAMGVIGKPSIQNQQDFNNFVSAINSKIDFRVNVATGQVYYYQPGLAGVEVLLEKDGQVIARTTTDSTGYYKFDDIFHGEYTVRIGTVAGDGWAQSSPAGGTYTVTIDETLKNQSGKDFATISKGSVSIADTSVVKGPDGKTYVNVEVALRDAYGAPPLRVT